MVFPDLDQVFRLTGETINSNWMSSLLRVGVDDHHYYIKRYASRGRWLRRFAGRSRLRAEWENLLFFHQLEIPTAELVAYGESGIGRNYRGALVTRELKGSRDLAALSTSACMRDRHWRQQVMLQLADAVARLHAAGFVHGDLKWRNILAGGGADPVVYIIDCPQGRRLAGPMLERGIVKDLACLDKVARQVLSRTDRMRFYIAYAGSAELGAADRRRLRRVLAFFAGRE